MFSSIACAATDEGSFFKNNLQSWEQKSNSWAMECFFVSQQKNIAPAEKAQLHRAPGDLTNHMQPNHIKAKCTNDQFQPISRLSLSFRIQSNVPQQSVPWNFSISYTQNNSHLHQMSTLNTIQKSKIGNQTLALPENHEKMKNQIEPVQCPTSRLFHPKCVPFNICDALKYCPKNLKFLPSKT